MKRILISVLLGFPQAKLQKRWKVAKFQVRHAWLRPGISLPGRKGQGGGTPVRHARRDRASPSLRPLPCAGALRLLWAPPPTLVRGCTSPPPCPFRSLSKMPLSQECFTFMSFRAEAQLKLRNLRPSALNLAASTPWSHLTHYIRLLCTEQS